MEQLLAEAKELADQGVKELILVAQETTLYGVDLYGEKTLPKLLHELAQIDGIEWIRIQYCYPEEITEELIQAIKTEEKCLSLPGYSDPARERCRSQADGTPHESGGASGADRASAGRDPRYCTPHDLNFRFPG